MPGVSEFPSVLRLVMPMNMFPAEGLSQAEPGGGLSPESAKVLKSMLFLPLCLYDSCLVHPAMLAHGVLPMKSMLYGPVWLASHPCP